MSNSDESPNVLYHYCSFDNSVKIMDSGALRFFRSTVMNDPQEVEYGLSLLLDVLYGFINEASNQSSKTRLATLLMHILRTFSKYDDSRFSPDLLLSLGVPIENALPIHQSIAKDQSSAENRSVYMFSFSEKKDNLNQWRLYGDNGAGMSLGFRFADLKNSTRKEKLSNTKRHKVMIGRVDYDPDHTNECLKSVIGEMISKSRNVYSVAEACYKFVVLSKSPSYEPEAEWRMYTYERTNSSVPEFCPSLGRIRPYLAISRFGRNTKGYLPIDEIWSGPRAAFDASSDQDWSLYLRTRESLREATPRSYRSEQQFR